VFNVTFGRRVELAANDAYTHRLQRKHHPTPIQDVSNRRPPEMLSPSNHASSWGLAETSVGAAEERNRIVLVQWQRSLHCTVCCWHANEWM